MMEEGKKINFYRLGLENGRRYRMEDEGMAKGLKQMTELFGRWG